MPVSSSRSRRPSSLSRRSTRDLFVSDRAGERESLDVGRSVVWLEVLLEAGDEVAADRVAELDEDFVAHALGGVDFGDRRGRPPRATRRWRRGRGDAGRQVPGERAHRGHRRLLCSSRSNTMAGMPSSPWCSRSTGATARCSFASLTVSREWGAATWTTSGALDRALRGRIALAEDEEAARGAPQQSKGYVEGCEQRCAFLSLARKVAGGGRATQQARSAYPSLLTATSSGIERPYACPAAQEALHAASACRPARLDDMGSDGGRPALPGSSAKPTTVEAFTGALRGLHQDEPVVFGERMEEFAYLANVLVAGTSGMAPAAPQRGGRRGDRHGVFSARWSSFGRIHRGEAEGTTDLRRVRRGTAPAWRGPALSRGQQRPGGRRCAKGEDGQEGRFCSTVRGTRSSDLLSACPCARSRRLCLCGRTTHDRPNRAGESTARPPGTGRRVRA